jgi:hypothetical protein
MARFLGHHYQTPKNTDSCNEQTYLPNHPPTYQSIKALTTLSSWYKQNAVTINTEKSSTSPARCYKQPTISPQVNNKPFAQTHAAKYLGQHLDTKLTWRNNGEKTTEKRKEKLSALKRLVESKWCSSRSILNATYKSYIKHTLQYGC